MKALFAAAHEFAVCSTRPQFQQSASVPFKQCRFQNRSNWQR